MITVDYKHINIDLVGEDGNAYSIMARVNRAMSRAGCSHNNINEVLNEMKEGDYNNLLNTVMRVFSVDGEGEEEDDWCEECGEPYEYCKCDDYYGADDDDDEEDCAN